MTTSNNPDEIRAEIERTRYELGQDVDALAEKVSGKDLTDLFQTWLYTKSKPATF